MRKYIVAVATAVLVLGSAVTGADAMTTSAPAAVGKAAQDITTKEQVTCRWVWYPAYGWRWACGYGYYPSYGGYYGGPFYGGFRFFGGHHHYNNHRHRGGHRHHGGNRRHR